MFYKVVSYQFLDEITHTVPFITGSDFGNDSYTLIQFHFHWGTNSSQGSEHQIDGKTYPGEVIPSSFLTLFHNLFLFSHFCLS